MGESENDSNRKLTGVSENNNNRIETQEMQLYLDGYESTSADADINKAS